MPDKTVKLDRKVPEFAVARHRRRAPGRSAAAGRKLVVYFYPKDNTPGCTSEGIEFRDLYPKFRKADTTIVGVSPDSVASHEKFKAKYEFPFELLADETTKVVRALRRDPREEHVRPEIHGRGAQHIPARREWRLAP